MGGIKHVQARQDRGMSRIQLKHRECTATHILREIHWSTSTIQMNARKETGYTATYNPGRDVMRCMSGIQTVASGRTETHKLEGKSWLHVRDSKGDRRCTATHILEGILAARQRFKRRPGGARQLTSWKR